MITDRELARYISNNLHLYLADEDKPVECKVVDVSKNNGGTVAGVQILMHGVDHGPVISMETIRGLLDIGMPREEVMKNIAELVHKEENIILLNKFDPEDYQSMKDYLSVMVINTDANKEALENLPHKETEDLSIISYINVPEDAVIGNGIIKVTKGLMNIWNISETELFADAEKNSSLINPPALFNVKKMIFKNDQRNYLTEPIPSPSIPLNGLYPEMYVLTNTQKVFGASVIVNTDVMDRICDIFPEGFTIIPSSIHEVMIVPGEDHDRYQELGEMVRSVNMTSAVSPEEVLSDRVYTYDRNSKSIHQVDESMYDKNCEQPEFKQSKSGMAQNNGLVYKEKQVDIEI